MQMVTEDTSNRGSTSKGIMLFSLFSMVFGIFLGMMRDLFARRIEPVEPDRVASRMAAELEERTA